MSGTFLSLVLATAAIAFLSLMLSPRATTFGSFYKGLDEQARQASCG